MTASHELAEAVTDPLPARGFQGWLDDNLTSTGMGAEIGDIPEGLVGSGQYAIQDLPDILTGADGTQYQVQRVWSEQDHAPVAFAAALTTGP